jgi:hypothetical protein
VEALADGDGLVAIVLAPESSMTVAGPTDRDLEATAVAA